MNRRQSIPLLLALLPAVLGGLAWLGTFRFGWLQDSVVYARVSLTVLVWWAGLLLTASLMAVVLAARFAALRGKAALHAAEADAAAARTSFLKRLDHELKNPLTALQLEIANIEAQIRESGSGDSDPARTIGNLKAQSDRLHLLVVQLRKLADLSSAVIEHANVDLERLLNEVVAEIQTTPEGMARRITLTLPQVPWPLPVIRGDPDLLFLAVHNVVSNAVKFSEEGAPIQVRAYEDDHQVVIETADTGRGIPEEDQEKIWDELFRGKTAGDVPGSGLGLALVRVIVQRHGGKASVRSRVGRGTVIILRFPIPR